MPLHTITKGLDLPILGEPESTVDNAPAPKSVAVVAADYHGMKPTMHVKPGDTVRRGELLFEDKKTPGVRYTALGGGTVTAVNRGAKRALQSVVVELDDDERGGRGTTVKFDAFTGKAPDQLSRDEVHDLLVESGVWTALRARPFSGVADPKTTPQAIFVTAIDTQPLAPPISAVMDGREEDWERGLHVLAQLTDGPVFLCQAPGTKLPAPQGEKFRVEEFSGPHPAGNVGLHVHLLKPVDRQRVSWYLGCQDVAMIGRLFESGELDVSRVVALGGPKAKKPRLLRTRIGAALDDILSGELVEDGEEELRVLSGSVFAGRKSHGEIHGYLGRYHQQITVLAEGREREFLGWLAPGVDKFSLLPAYLSKWLPKKKYAFTTSTQGSPRAIVPIGLYERVFPLDLPPNQLLKAIVVGDIEKGEELGVLELDEEDLALCTFVDPGKHDFGTHLRELLTTIEKEG